MVTPSRWQTIEAELASLRPHDVDADRADLIRARCRRLLAARRRTVAPLPPAVAAWRRLEPALALGLGALYLTVAIRASLHLAAAAHRLMDLP